MSDLSNFNLSQEEAQEELGWTPDEIRNILRECYVSTKRFAKAFFPERFHLNFSSIHDDIFSILDGKREENAVIAPRGVGKSTIVNLTFPIKKLVFRETNFLIQASKTARQAVADSNDVKRELLTNLRIRAVFGSFEPQSRADDFSKEKWVTPPLLDNAGQIRHAGTLVMPTSWTQEIRGVKYGRFRPDLIIVDDLEGTESVLSEEQRAKLLDWFMTDLVNLVQRAHKRAPDEFPWQIFVIGTLLHQDSLMANLVDPNIYPGWRTKELSICDAGFHSNWVDFMTDEDIAERKEEYEKVGRLDKFCMEYMGTVIPPDAPFQKQHFLSYKEEDLAKKLIENVVIVDPAKTKELRSSDSAIVCWGFDGLNLYLRDLVVRKFYPDELYDEIFAMCDRWEVRTLAVEKTGLESFITHPIRTLMLKRGSSFELVELTATGDKMDRIAALAPFYRKGLIFHNKAISAPLEVQLMSYPKSKRSDAMDAAAYIVQLLEKGERYFAYGGAQESQLSEVDFEAKVREAQRVCEPPLEVAAVI